MPYLSLHSCQWDKDQGRGKSCTHQLTGEAGLRQAVLALRARVAAAEIEVAQERRMHHRLHPREL